VLLREAWYVALSLARQYGGRAALERHQLRQLNRVLRFCRERVPFYRDDPRYAVGPLASLADLTALPVLTKADLRSRPAADFVADGTEPERCVVFHTSGTTGQRLRVLHDRNSFDYHTAACVRRFLATGRYLPTYRLSHLRHFTPPRRAFERLGLFRRQVILTHRPMAEIKAALLANRPRVIIGYPVHLRELLRDLSAQELTRLRRTLRLLFTESELLVPEQRRALVEGFGVPVFDEYSAYEVLNIYFECRHARRHLAEDRVHVEIVDDAGDPLPDGTEGWVVVTAFMERAMPLLRYGLGDAGVIEPGRCPCGRRFRTMRLTRGRVNDRVVLPDGTALYSDTFLELAETHPGVAECYVRQDRDGLVRIYVVPDDHDPAAAGAVLASIKDALFELAGRSFPLDVAAAERVPITAGGKGRFVTSEYQLGIRS
jgi:phenylacetate-coenzyme A ligase PaaK-like adenylate-forming protein